MIDAENIGLLLGLNEPPSEEIIKAFTEFSMLFSRVEPKYFGGMARVNSSDDYTLRIMNDGKQVPKTLYEFFRQRYLLEADAERRLNALCNWRQAESESIRNGLLKQAPEEPELVSVVLKVLIRVRHNLLHGNKDSYLYEQSADQTILLQQCVGYLSVLIK